MSPFASTSTGVPSHTPDQRLIDFWNMGRELSQKTYCVKLMSFTAHELWVTMSSCIENFSSERGLSLYVEVDG